jgi:hypothetical protein
VVLQSARVRWDQLRSKVSLGTPERPLATYLTDPPPLIRRGLEASREAFGRIAAKAREDGAQTAIVLMPARLQVNDDDFGNLAAAVRAAGGEMDRQAATRRFAEALAPLGLPVLDLQPILARQPEPKGIFFQRNVHLTPRGHRVTAEALLEFMAAHGLTGPAVR